MFTMMMVLALRLAVPLADTVVAPPSPASLCADGLSRDALNKAFGSTTGAGGLIGGDYARAQVLPDGRVLWVFQDVFLGGDGSSLRRSTFMHNAGLVQDGTCFRALTGGSTNAPFSWIGGAEERPLRHWYWPLGSTITADGHIAQFVVEMENHHGTGAAPGATPERVWIATISLPELEVVDLRLAPDSNDRPLYGFSITSDSSHTYLYGNCYRQFTNEAGLVAHDPECGRDTFVARVPLGRPDVEPEYWQGNDWGHERRDAQPIMTRGQLANPMQVRHTTRGFVGVTKVDDWFGTKVTIDVAATAAGPWRSVASIGIPTMCGAECNTYFATLLPWTSADGALLIIISNNAWDMRRVERHSTWYRPSVYEVQLPAVAR
jgi:hypothetical protein